MNVGKFDPRKSKGWKRRHRVAMGKLNVRIKLSKASRIAWTKPIVRKRYVKASKMRWLKPGMKEQTSKSVKAAMTKLVKNKMSKSQKVRWSNLEARKKQSIRAKVLWHRHQQKVQKQLKKNGWFVLDKGWPDFICTRGLRTVLIEAKAPGDKLLPEQEKMHKLLHRLGISVKILRPDNLCAF